MEGSSTTTVTAEEGGEVTYIDQGDRWLVIDNRGAVQKRKTLPKSVRDIGVAPTVRTALEEEFQAAAERDEEAANVDPLVFVPPAESDEDKAAREQAATEALAAADEQRTGAAEEASSDPPEAPLGAETTASVNATDAARTYAAEKGIDLTQVTGTGQNGAITKPDVEAYEASQAGS